MKNYIMGFKDMVQQLRGFIEFVVFYFDIWYLQFQFKGFFFVFVVIGINVVYLENNYLQNVLFVLMVYFKYFFSDIKQIGDFR